MIFVAGVKFVQRSLERGKEGRVGAWLAMGVHPGMFVKVTLDFNFTSLTFICLFSLSPRTVDAGVSYVSDVPPRFSPTYKCLTTYASELLLVYSHSF